MFYSLQKVWKRIKLTESIEQIKSQSLISLFLPVTIFNKKKFYVWKKILILSLRGSGVDIEALCILLEQYHVILNLN